MRIMLEENVEEVSLYDVDSGVLVRDNGRSGLAALQERLDCI